MAEIIALEAVRQHLRLEDDYSAEQLEIYLLAAHSSASSFLNRRIFASDAERLQAIASVPALVDTAVAAHMSGTASAELIADADSRIAALLNADAALREVRTDAYEIQRGIVINPAIRAAILLTTGHLFENREDSVSEKLIELPNGCRALLQPYRIGMGV